METKCEQIIGNDVKCTGNEIETIDNEVETMGDSESDRSSECEEKSEIEEKIEQESFVQAEPSVEFDVDDRETIISTDVSNGPYKNSTYKKSDSLEVEIVFEKSHKNVKINHSDEIATENGKKKIKEEKPPTKVVVRRLPPTMTKELFIEQVSPLPPIDYMYFVPADSSMGIYAFSRAYMNFVNQEDLFVFSRTFDNYVFLDSKGQEYPAVVEFSPFQRVPKQVWSSGGSVRGGKRSTGGRGVGDPLAGTLDSDPVFITFKEALLAEELESSKPGANTIKQHYFETTENSSPEKEVSTTPLLEFLKLRRAEKARVKEERREEKKRKEAERKQKQKKRTDDSPDVKVLQPAIKDKKEGKDISKDGKIGEKKRKEKEMSKEKILNETRSREFKSRCGKSYQEERQKQAERREEQRKKSLSGALESGSGEEKANGGGAGGEECGGVEGVEGGGKGRDKKGGGRSFEGNRRKGGREGIGEGEGSSFLGSSGVKGRGGLGMRRGGRSEGYGGGGFTGSGGRKGGLGGIPEKERKGSVLQQQRVTTTKVFKNSYGRGGGGESEGKGGEEEISGGGAMGGRMEGRRRRNSLGSKREIRGGGGGGSGKAEGGNNGGYEMRRRRRRNSLDCSPSGNGEGLEGKDEGGRLSRREEMRVQHEEWEEEMKVDDKPGKGGRSSKGGRASIREEKSKSVVTNEEGMSSTTFSKEYIGEKRSVNTERTSHQGKKDPRTERRIRNKDRPSLEIYRPGMGKFSKRRLEKEKALGSSTEMDSPSHSPSPTPNTSKSSGGRTGASHSCPPPPPIPLSTSHSSGGDVKGNDNQQSEGFREEETVHTTLEQEEHQHKECSVGRESSTAEGVEEDQPDH